MEFLAGIVSLYATLIWIRIILSWIRLPQLRQSGLYDFLCSITDPFLRIFRSKRAVAGSFDFSPLLALMVLNILRTALEMIGLYNKVTIFLLLAVVIQNIWGYIIRFIFLILLVMLAVRFFVARNPNPQAQIWLENMDRNLNGPVSVVFRLFFSGKEVTDQTLTVVSFFFYLAVYLALKYGIQALTQFLVSL